METVDKMNRAVCDRCAHVSGHVSYLKNEPGCPPVLLVENCSQVNIVTLTNQVIRINCPACWIIWRRMQLTEAVSQ